MVFKDHRRCDLEPEPLWVGACVPSWWFLRSPDLPQQMQHRLYEQKVRQHDLRAALSDSKWEEIWDVWETSQDFKVRFSKAMGSTDVWNLQSKKYIDSQGVVLLIYPSSKKPNRVVESSGDRLVTQKPRRKDAQKDSRCSVTTGLHFFSLGVGSRNPSLVII